MRFTLRQLKPQELDHELIWLSVSLGSLALAVAWLVAGLPWPHCLFHDLTGLPCLTCGATRATIEFFHAHPVAALRWNPLVFGLLCALTLYDVYAFSMITLRAPRLRLALPSVAAKKYARLLVIAALALNWIYLLSHRQAFV
ncbi:MAG: DUF2752 domain-containing protein [Chthoniobacterales bacterium]